MPVGDISPEIAITLTAVLSLVWAITAPQRLQWVCALVALTGIGVAGALVTAQIGTVRLSFAGTFALDEVGAWAQLMILGGTAFCVFLSPGWFRSDPRHGEFYTILLFSALGAMMMVGAADLLQLVMGVLLSSVTGYTLAAYHRDWGLSVEAGMKYFLLGALANALLVTGVVLVFGMLGSSGYDAIADRLAEGNAASPLLYAGFALLAVGVAFKLGAAPAHAWVPDVAEGAPAPAAAFLTVVPKIGAAIALARIVELVPPDTLAVTVLGLSDHALPALLTFVGSYAISNLAAFAVITHLRGRTKLADYVGLATERPVAAAVLTLSFLSLVGIPPLVGFVGKLTLFIATIQGGYAWLAVVAAANTVASLFYYARVIGPVYFGAASKPVAVLDGWSSAALWLGGLAVVIVTLAAGPAFIVFGKATLLP
mgnify:CR=1 FL=1